MKHQQKLDQTRISPDSVRVIGSACVLNTCSPIVLTVECRTLYKTERLSPISYTHVSIWLYVLRLTPNHTPFK